jgi:dienelactone hydrolase
MGYRLSQLTEATFPRLLDGISNIEQWEAKRERIKAVWRQAIGWMPAAVPLAYTIVSERYETDHIRIHLTYETGFGDQVYAYLLIPGAQLNPQGKRYPAMLALHPTDKHGKADIATSEGRANRQYALELVSRGYVVLAPDTITTGERIYPDAEAFQTAPFYAAFPESTAVGKMIHDHQQGLDLLQALPYVDPQRIGAIGHSLGAYNAYFLAAVDDRIKVVVSSCGLCPFMQDPTPDRWGQRDWFSHIPKLTEHINEDDVPFEFHEIMALVAPRPLLNWFTQNDAIFPNWQAAAFASNDIHNVYQWLGHQECYVSLLGNEGHDFPRRIRTLSYQFIDHWLMEEDSI